MAGLARWAAAVALLAAPAPLLFAAHSLLSGWALYSEEQVLSANVLHPLFNSAEHFAEAHWRPEMAQRERLEGLTAAYRGTVQALGKLGLNAFLESSSLIGLLRHDGHMPWEVDGDVGVIEAECRAANATKELLERAVGEELVVLKFACSCQESCEGDNRRMAGRVAHRPTGVVIDIFMYGPVREPRPWQTKGAFADQEWWERIDDHADYTFPRDVLLPLQPGTFEGIPMMLPQKPREFLSWEYGRCLGSHVWPWRMLLYSPVSVLIPGAVVAKGAVMLSGESPLKGRRLSPWIAVISGVYAAVALGAFQGGITLFMLLATWLCEFVAVLLAPGLLGAGCGAVGNARALAVRRRHRQALLLAIAVVILELRGCLGQILCQVDDFYIHPLRPKTWTLCLFGHCWDF